MTKKGVNVWYELMTSDVDAAKRFYSEVVGWKPQAWQGADLAHPYTMWMVGEQPIGGLMQLPAEAAAMGAPPHWMAYTTVDDVDASVAQIETQGGRVFKAAFDIPKVGRVAIVADPQGAAFAVYKPADEMPPADRSLHGAFCWSELNTTDYQAAWRFYAPLFSWTEREQMEMGDGETYFVFEAPSKAMAGGMSNMAKQMGAPPHWLHYVNVDDVTAALARVEQHGGEALNGPMDIPGGGVIAQCRDPQGALFALHAAPKK